MAKDNPKNTGRFAKGNPGKPKGATNKTTALFRAMVESAADGLGGADRLQQWAQEDPKNESAFWTVVFPKLAPLQVNGPGANGEHIFERIVREVVDTKA